MPFIDIDVSVQVPAGLGDHNDVGACVSLHEVSCQNAGVSELTVAVAFSFFFLNGKNLRNLWRLHHGMSPVIEGVKVLNKFFTGRQAGAERFVQLPEELPTPLESCFFFVRYDKI